MGKKNIIKEMEALPNNIETITNGEPKKKIYIFFYIVGIITATAIIIISITLSQKSTIPENQDQCSFDQDCINNQVCVLTTSGSQQCKDCRNNDDCKSPQYQKKQLCDLYFNECILPSCTNSPEIKEPDILCNYDERPDDLHDCFCRDFKYVWRPTTD